MCLCVCVCVQWCTPYTWPGTQRERSRLTVETPQREVASEYFSTTERDTELQELCSKFRTAKSSQICVHTSMLLFSTARRWCYVIEKLTHWPAGSSQIRRKQRSVQYMLIDDPALESVWVCKSPWYCLPCCQVGLPGGCCSAWSLCEPSPAAHDGSPRSTTSPLSYGSNPTTEQNLVIALVICCPPVFLKFNFKCWPYFTSCSWPVSTPAQSIWTVRSSYRCVDSILSHIYSLISSQKVWRSEPTQQ